jgi:hypothetical protein
LLFSLNYVNWLIIISILYLDCNYYLINNFQDPEYTVYTFSLQLCRQNILFSSNEHWW